MHDPDLNFIKEILTSVCFIQLFPLPDINHQEATVTMA